MEFGGDWSNWSEFTAVFLRWVNLAASLECPTLVNLYMEEGGVRVCGDAVLRYFLFQLAVLRFQNTKRFALGIWLVVNRV